MEANRNEALELLAQPGWAWRLAQALCRDESEAEDALGEARLAALRAAPASGDGDSLRAWVARVVRNAVRRGRRGERRRAERESQAARAEALPDAVRVLEREEARRALVHALLALPEPFRATLIAHYYDGQRPAAIAARAGLPPSTVRNRLARGRALLRRELERNDAREPRDWLAAVAPLLVRPEPLAPLVLGGLAVGTKTTMALGSAAALALLGSLWWWAADGAPEESMRELADAPSEIETPPTATPDEPSRSVPDLVSSTQERSPVASGVDAARADLLLRVVDEAGAALSGAHVAWANASILTSYWQAQQNGAAPDLERWISEAGQTGVADDAGEYRLPSGGSDLAVAGRSGELWSWKIAKAAVSEPIVLVLESSHRLVLEVVDTEGKAVAGVPVGLFMQGVDHGEASPWRSRTGDDGRATIHQLEHHMRNGAYPSDLPFVGIAGPLDIERVAIDPANPPEKPVRFVLPDCGSVRVRLSGRDGPLTSEPFWVGISELTPDRSTDGFARGKNHSLTARPEGGRAELSWTHVGLGLDLLVEAQPPGPLQRGSARVRGPARKGEEVLVELQLEPEGSRIAARLIGPDGAPMRARWVEMHLLAEDPQVAIGEILARSSSGDEGRVVLAVDERLRGLRCRWRLIAYDRPDRRFVTEARTLLPLIEGELDLGDVQLAEPATFVAGQVLDAHGAPAPEVQVSVARWTRMGGEDAPEVWNWASGVTSPNTDAEGRFHLREDPPAGRYAIAARTSEFGFGEFVSFERGQEDVVVRLPSAGGLAGRLLLLDDVEAARLRVTVDPQDAPGAWNAPTVAPRPDGAFELTGLEAGIYRVSVRRVWDDASEPLIVVQDVSVAEGETRRDPRLDPLDLRASLHGIELELVDSRRAPVPRGHVALQPYGMGSPSVRVAFEFGTSRLLGIGSSSDVTVVAPGFRTLRVEDVRGARRIELEPGFPVRVRLPAGLSLPEAPYGLRLDFWHSGHPRGQTERVFDLQDRAGDQWGGAAQLVEELDGRTQLDVILPQEGSWGVIWLLRVRKPDGDRSWYVHSDAVGNSFEVPADGTPIEVLLAPPGPEDLARAMRELERK
jgi:RNA polymerase sigma-70 factor (ECF subfamily)